MAVTLLHPPEGWAIFEILFVVLFTTETFVVCVTYTFPWASTATPLRPYHPPVGLVTLDTASDVLLILNTFP